MSRNSTIELLNETDALGYRMRWQLFVQENERVVYGDYTGWQPGEFLHRHPHSIRADSHISDDIEDEFEDVDGSWGNYVRPMYEIMGPTDFHIASNHRVYISKSDPWCGVCLVSWQGAYGDPCWNCERVSYGPYITQEQRSDLLFDKYRTRRRRYEERQAEIYASPQHVLDSMIYQRRSHAARQADQAWREFYDRITSGLTQQPAQILVSYSEADAEFSRLLFSYRVEHYPPHNNIMVFDVETFESRPSAWEIMFGQPRHEDAFSRRTIVSHPRRNGRSAPRVWIDEWAGAPVPPNINVKVDDVTISIPRNWREMRRTSPIPKARTDIIDRIVERHMKGHPEFYRNPGFPQVGSIATAMRNGVS